MNPGLIPPADVAATAKKGLELREKFQPRWDFSWDSSRTTAGGASKRSFRDTPRSAPISHATRS
jgi:hypothetical protein